MGLKQDLYLLRRVRYVRDSTWKLFSGDETESPEMERIGVERSSRGPVHALTSIWDVCKGAEGWSHDDVGKGTRSGQGGNGKRKNREEKEREREIHRLSSIVESDAIRNEIGFSVGHSVLLSKYPNRFSRKGVGIRSVAAFSIPSVPFLFVPCTLARKLQAPRLSCSCTSRTCTWMETAMPTPPVLLLIRSSPF